MTGNVIQLGEQLSQSAGPGGVIYMRSKLLTPQTSDVGEAIISGGRARSDT